MPDKIVLVNQFGEQSANVLADDMGANSKKITNLADPTADQDAATKKYVDDNAGGLAQIQTQINVLFYSANDGTTLLGTKKAILVKTGNVVSFMLESASGINNGPGMDCTLDFATTYSNANLTTNPIPAQYRPSYNQDFTFPIVDAGTVTTCTVRIYKEGSIDLYKDGNNQTFTGQITSQDQTILQSSWVISPLV
jgi:hypothetical protein